MLSKSGLRSLNLAYRSIRKTISITPLKDHNQHRVKRARQIICKLSPNLCLLITDLHPRMSKLMRVTPWWMASPISASSAQELPTPRPNHSISGPAQGPLLRA